MKICAVIAEYNPLTNGHLYHISKAKAETGCDTLIVLLSGSFTNHGEVCVADKLTRATWAIEAGADCVLELPTVYSLSSPNIFAQGALKTLKPLGDFTLSFGSETESLENIEHAVDNLTAKNKDFKTFFQNFMTDSVPKTKLSTACPDNSTACSDNTTSAQNAATQSNTQNTDTTNPNNFWASEYIKASKKLNIEPTFHTVKIFESKGQNFLPAKAVRKLLKENQDISKSVPPFVTVRTPDYQKLNSLCVYALNNLTKEHLSEIAGVYNGLEHRLKRAKLSTMKEVTALALNQTSRSDLKKIALCATLSLKKELVEIALNLKPYFRVLATKESRKDILDYLNKISKNVFLTADDCSQKNKIRLLVDIDEKAEKLHSLVENR